MIVDSQVQPLYYYAMNRPRLINAIKVAWSAFCGIAAVLLLFLWVRSYGRVEIASYIRGNHALGISASEGRVCPFFESDSNLNWKQLPGRWFFDSNPTADQMPRVILEWEDFLSDYHVRERSAPDWLIMILLSAALFTPWLPWSFSLRTLLIATTLIAIVLGLMTWFTSS